jgi:transposase
MNRLKALYRSWAIPCAGRDVYYTRHRSEWLGKIPEAGTRRRAEQLYLQLDMLQHLRQQARRELLAESRKHAITTKLRKIPSLGPIRSALAVALIQTPHRFRTKRQLWAYSGLALETRTSGEHRYVRGQLQRSKANLHPRTEQGSQSRSERSVQSCRHPGECTARTVSGFLSAIAGQRHQADHGPSDPGAQDRSHCINSVEEGRKLRR